ncbi:hypothetical protein POSPLADRAFT_1101459, partial [Postia placenta MAD-698-R-SB12]
IPSSNILIDLPSQSIHTGKVGQKLAAGIGSGADTSTSGRWATEDREIKEAAGIAESIAVYLCLQK